MRDNYPIKGQHAEYFTGDTSTIDNDFLTVPTLLRRIADFIEANTIRDAEFDGLQFGTSFDDEDRSHEHALLYYHLENESRS